MRTHAHTVIVGAGIVGVSAAWELARLAREEILVIDQNELFQTGGSTSHAPGGVFQNNSSRTVSRLAQWTVETFRDVSAEGSPTYFPTGSLEIATTEARWADLHRKVGYARAWGLDARLLSPIETGELLPYLDTSLIHGAIFVSGDGIVRAVPTVERIAKRAGALGVEFQGGVALTRVESASGRVIAVETSQGRIACERVLLCGGIWGPLVGEIAGVPIPIQPCAHPYVRSRPLGPFTGLDEVVYPLWRHQDHSMYLWQDGPRLGVGNYRHEPHIVAPEEIGGHAELPFDASVMAPGIREAERLLPPLRGFEIQDRVYGMFSFTPDGQSLMGEAAGTKGLWTAMAIWVTHAAGAGRAIAQLMETGACELDLREVDVNRFAPHQLTRSYVQTRGRQQYREVYDIIHPKQQIAQPRGLRRSPWHAHQQQLGAFCFESNGWERPQWFEANRDLSHPERGVERDAWSAREWSPICAAEHVATRETAGLFDLSTFMRIEVSGRDAVRALAHLTCSRVDRPIGRVTYSLLLNERGGIESDVTIARLAEDRFMIMTGSASGPRDLGWIRRNTRQFDRLSVRDVTSAWCAMGVWGPHAGEILASVAEDDVSERAIRPYAIRRVTIAGIPVHAIRMSYVGEEGLELHTSTEYGAALYEAVWKAGRESGLIAAGGAAMDTLRLEAGYRALGTDLRGEHSPFEAGLDFAVDASRDDFIGAAALASRPVGRKLACMTFDDLGIMPLGKEPLLAGGEIVGYVSSAGFGYTAGYGIAYGYLPTELAEPGTQIELEYFGERYPLTLSREPLVPPARDRRAVLAAG
jgi:glycine cleavage system aminomethyltransferase T/glycine/D-amino acid oxidase-like deaminating enzyme